MTVRDVTDWLTILSVPTTVLLFDLLLLLLFGPDRTITAAVRHQAALSPWPEVLYLASAYLLHGHFFRRWF